MGWGGCQRSMEDVHGRCVDVVVTMLYTDGWRGWGGDDDGYVDEVDTC